MAQKDTNQTLPPTLSVREVVELLGISMRTFYRLKRANRLPFPHVPNMPRRYSRDVVLAAINGKQRAA